jgi:tripartite ATP-independent transporter DctP family solute receptor
MKKALGCLLVAVCLGVLPTVSFAKTTIKVATEASEGHQIYEVLLFMKKELESRLPGELEFALFPGGQLGKDAVVLNGLRQGTHEFTVSASPVASLEPGYGVFEAPFLFGDRDEVRKVVNGKVGQELMRRLGTKGLVALGIGELGFRQITNNVRPIVTPGDLEGLKIRIPNNPFRGVIFRTFGANPTPIAYGEVFAALRQGVIDGQENPLGSIYSAKFNEVQKYLSLSNHLFTPETFLASRIHYDRWPADVQQAMREVGREAAAYSFVVGERLDGELLSRIRQTTQINKIDSVAFKAKAKPLWDQIAERAGRDLMEQVLNELGVK